MARKVHRWTQEQGEFFRQNIKGRSYKELADMLNTEFQLDLTYSAVKGYASRHHLTNSRDTQLKPGMTPHNKGLRGVRTSPGTEFKPGNRPHNWRPVGSERTNSDGYVDVKIAEPRTWKGKHTLVWEEAHGPVPKGHVVIFGDKDKRNFDLDNLLLVSRKQLARLNQNGLIKDDADLTRTGVIIADVLGKIGEVERNNKKRRR